MIDGAVQKCAFTPAYRAAIIFPTFRQLTDRLPEIRRVLTEIDQDATYQRGTREWRFANGSTLSLIVAAGAQDASRLYGRRFNEGHMYGDFTVGGWTEVYDVLRSRIQS